MFSFNVVTCYSYVNSFGKFGFFFSFFFRHSQIYSNSIPGAFENDIKWICFLKTTKTSIQLNIGRTFLRKEEQRHLNGTSLIFTLRIYIVKHTVLAHNQIKWPWWMCNPRFRIICMTYMYAMEIQMVTFSANPITSGVLDKQMCFVAQLYFQIYI